MASTPEMVDSVNSLILADRGITIENISKHLGIPVHGDLAFSKISCHCVSSGKCKAIHCSKNSGNYLSSWLGTAATSSLQSKTGPILFILECKLKEFLYITKFSSDDEVPMNKLLKTQPKNVCVERIQKLVFL